MERNTLDPRWDNKIVDYNLEKHNWRQYFLDAVQEKYPQVTSLETVHTVFAPNEINDFVWDVQRICRSEEFAKRLDRFAEEVIMPQTDGDDFMIQDTVGMRVVIPNQSKHGRTLNFHQGVWYGHGAGMYSFWTPLTEAYGSNTMQILPWAASREITQRTYDEKWSYQQIQEQCLKHAIPCNTSPGQSWLFQQGHIHGNVNNDTDITRWSFDTRLLIKGGDYGKRRPGGFFRLFKQYKKPIGKIDTSLNWINYIDMEARFNKTTPFFWTSMVMDQFCKDNNITPVDYPLELSFCDWEPMLEDFIRDPNIGGILVPSILGITTDSDRRNFLLSLALEQRKPIIFIDERIMLTSKDDLEYINNIVEYYTTEEQSPDLYLGHTR